MTRQSQAWVGDLFRAIDGRDADAFLAFLCEDVVFRFGNSNPVTGKAAVRDAVTAFWGSVSGLRHDVLEAWHLPGVAVCHGRVTYTRRDSSTLCVPFANVFHLDGNRIKEYLIFADVSELQRPG